MYSEVLEKYKDCFDGFLKILTEYNKRYNLTAISGENEIYIKHFYDSVVPEKYFPHGAKVVEIGSGGGFPSIPLKIVRDDLSFTLIESTGKKCEYLQAVVDKMGLDSVKVINIRAEEGGKDPALREKFDVATARAVARMNTLCEYCLPFVKVGGRFVAYKSEEEEIEESMNAIKVLGGEIEKTEPYELPSGFGARLAVVIKKVKPTPANYPRGRGLERKRPL